MPSTPLSSALSRVKRSARSEMSVATTCVDVAACAQGLDAASGADVEPASRRRRQLQRRQGQRGAADTRARGLRAAARPAPPRRGRSRSTTRRRRASSTNDCGRMSASGRMSSPSSRGEAERREARERRCAAAPRPRRPPAAASPSTNRRAEHGERVACGRRARAAAGRAQTARRSRRRPPRPTRPQRVGREAGGAQVGGEGAAQGGIGVGEHASIQTPASAAPLAAWDRGPPRRETVESHSIVRS